MRLQRAETDVVKGCAILLMFTHHLFAMKERWPSPESVAFVIPSLPIEYELGVFGRVCVPLFLFISGYGLAFRHPENLARASLRRALSFYGVYLANFILLIGIAWLLFRDTHRQFGTISFEFRWTFSSFFQNLFLIRPKYSMEWWFARLYLETLVLVWPLCELVSRRSHLLALALSVLLFAASGLLSWVPDGLLSWQVCFVIGFVLNREGTDFFHRALAISARAGPLARLGIGFLFAAIAFALRKRSGPDMDMLVTPLVVISALAFFPGRSVCGRALSYLGGHSANMWLNHTFVCYYFFHEEFFALKYSVVLVPALVLASLAISFATRPFARLISAALERLPFINEEKTALPRPAPPGLNPTGS